MDLNHFIYWAKENLLNSGEAKSYLSGRGVSEEISLRFDVGFINADYEPSPSLDKYHSDACESENKCDTCRFLKWSSNSRVKDRIVLPLSTYSGSFVGFQTRSIYEKTYDTFLVTKRPEAYFFGLSPNIQKIWVRDHVILVEGPFDCLVLQRFTDHPVLAITTNSTNEMQSRFLRRYVNNLYLFLDRDTAGRDGGTSIMRKTPELSHAKLEIPLKYQCKDVNDMWKKLGDKNFGAEIEKILSRVI